LEQLRADFEARHYFRIPNFLAPELLDFVQSEIDRGEFYGRVHQNIGNDLCLRGNAAFGALLFLFNDETLFRIVREITGCPQIGCFDGRIYRVIPGEGHSDSWHDDRIDQRLVGMTVNLSKQEYAGGILQLRDVASGKIEEVSNAGSGDAVIFRLSDTLEHRITALEGKAQKTAFAGWFRAEPDFLSLLKRRTAVVLKNPADAPRERTVTFEKDNDETNFVTTASRESSLDTY